MVALRFLALCILGSTLGAGSSDSSYKTHHEEARSSFTPTSTNNAHSLSRPVAAQPLVYAQSRDSYSNAVPQPGYSAPQGATAAASSSSYGAPGTGGAGGYGQGPGQQSMTYYYYHYPAQHGGGGGYGDTSGYEDTVEGIDGAGLGGLAGLLGLKGLKGLGGLGLLALLKILKKLLLPLLLPFLLLLPLLLLFIPIPVITIPAGRRALEADGVGSLVASRAYQTAKVAQEVLTSAMCVERIACELSTRTHGTYLDKMITQVFEKTESMSSKKWKRAMRAYIDSGFRSEAGTQDNSTTEAPPSASSASSQSGCSKYSCDLYKEFTTRLGVKNATGPLLGPNEVPT